MPKSPRASTCPAHTPLAGRGLLRTDRPVTWTTLQTVLLLARPVAWFRLANLLPQAIVSVNATPTFGATGTAVRRTLLHVTSLTVNTGSQQRQPLLPTGCVQHGRSATETQLKWGAQQVEALALVHILPVVTVMLAWSAQPWPHSWTLQKLKTALRLTVAFLQHPLTDSAIAAKGSLAVAQIVLRGGRAVPMLSNLWPETPLTTVHVSVVTVPGLMTVVPTAIVPRGRFVQTRTTKRF